MSCEYMSVCDNRDYSCKTVKALGEVKDDLEGVMSITEIRRELCLNLDWRARMQCPAYVDLVVYKRDSRYAKK